MLKLKLENIKKTYGSGEIVTALKGVSLDFRKSELVAILGPSGCGKTTLLNIIGGLDRYDSGDLIINGLSTKKFKNSDWDAYRNHSIGFVFQNYNLIGHQTVLQNVEIALTLSGVSPAERKRKAVQALTEVGLLDQIKKKPSQLSGGQMQRVAIARALINNPDIILADEPTGALDSQTSVQVMDLLKEISETRLVIMVTHNGELADKYSNRIIRFKDGEVLSDSNPVLETEKEETTVSASEKPQYKKTSMSLFTATSLSFKNLLTKRGRTIITAFAGSIGIIGVALVLALSSGLSSYISTMQADTLAGFPITISSGDIIKEGPRKLDGEGKTTLKKYTNKDALYSYNADANRVTHTNVITEDYFNYINKLQSDLSKDVSTISYQRNVNMNVLAKAEDSVVKYETINQPSGMGGFGRQSKTYWQEMPNNKDFILSQYDLIGKGSRLPSSKNEVAIVVDEYNRLDEAFFQKLGFSLENKNIKLSDFIGKTMLKVVPNDNFYTKNNELFSAATPTEYTNLYNGKNGVDLTIVGILRIKKDAKSSGYFSQGFVYTTDLTDYVVNTAKNSEVALAQKSSDKDVLNGATFVNNDAKDKKLISLGANTTPTGINIYPKNFEAKDRIKNYLDKYNSGKSEKSQIIYTDMAEQISNMTRTLLDTVSYVLIGFASISLIVSTIMIGIITYVSVIERTKEIGILRSVGARKKDISRVFNAETMIVGFTAGVIGVGLSYLLTIPINSIIFKLTKIEGIASLNPLHAVILIAGSMFLTLIAGLFPSRMAAKKDPVIALRTE